MPREFLEVALGTYFSVLYKVLKHAGVIFVAQSDASVSPTTKATLLVSSFWTKLVAFMAFIVPKYVAGVTTEICSCITRGKL